MVLYYSRCQDFPNNLISKGACIVFYQGVTIDHCTHVPGPVAQSSAWSEYNSACTAGISLAHLSILYNELMDKDPEVVPEQAPLVLLDRKSSVCMAKSIKGTKHTIHIYRRMCWTHTIILVPRGT